MSRLVEGFRLPHAVAGHPALELCNTKAMWGLPIEREYLTDFTAAVLWAGEHRLITTAEARAWRERGARFISIGLESVLAPAVREYLRAVRA